MAFTWQIEINKSGSGYTYSPASLNAVAIGDEVTFANNTDAPHWPRLITPVITGSPATYFMAHQIAAHSTSTTWIPGMNGTVTYGDSLDTRPTRPTGRIVVANPASSTTTVVSTEEE